MGGFKMLQKRIVSISLTLILAVTIFPGLNFTASAAPPDLTRAAVFTADEGNIARLATVRQLTNTTETRYNPNTGAGIDRPGINSNFCNNSYGTPNVQVLRVTDGIRPSSGTANGYLSWSYTDDFGVSNRLYFVLNWGQPFTIDAVRCDWWTDSNVTVPNSEARVEWLDGTVWREVTNMRNPATGAAVTNIGTLGMGNWNAVTFDPVVTSQLRLRLYRTGTITNGIGLGEWEVFGFAGDPELLSVSVTGETQPVISAMNTYTANVVFPNLDGVTYEWSTNNANVSIIGGNTGKTVNVEAVSTGSARLSVIAKHDSGVKETTGYIDINVQGISVDVTGDAIPMVGEEKVYTASASAGTMPLTYEWSLNNENAVIVGSSTGSTVTVKGVAAGTTRITCKIANADRQLEATDFLDVTFKVMTALDYIGATAAGRAPILPKRVVVDGLRFDLPTSNRVNNFEFGEEFEQSLVPVVWDTSTLTAANYATAGSTFEVSGVTAAGSRAPGLPAKAIFKVNAALSAPDYNHSITSENVIFDDVFWAPKQTVNATTTMDAAFTQLAGSASYAERNFVNARSRLQEVWNGNTNPARPAYSGYVFQDTDVYKTLEGVAYNLAAVWDTETEARKKTLLDKAKYWISLIEDIQYADGYLNSCFSTRSTTTSGGSGNTNSRWTYFARHEMYCIGHFLEAAVAYTRFAVATGQDDAYALYEVGRRTSDHIVDFFGPGGKRVEVPGHEEVELAMMKFATLCEEYEGVGAGQKYRDTVELLIDRRGRRTGVNARNSGYSGGTYSQDATPLVDETAAVGHAVRAMYFYTGATDIAIALPESNPNKAAFLRGINNIYESVIETNNYITGGLGSGESSEGFGPPWHIRNSSAYTETCAAIAGANWYQRLNLYYEDAKYADAYERSLYNGVLVGVNLQGNRFAYSTGLDGTLSRGTWQGCACCPPNVIRTIANIGGYMYTVNKDNIFVNLYGGSTGHINVQGDDIVIRQETQYPWEGDVKMTVTPSVNKTFTLSLRLPGWVKAQKYQQVTLKIDGEEIDATANAKGYIPITRVWPATGTVINYDIPMEIRLTEADANVTRVYVTATNRDPDSGQNNKVVVERGPIVFMAESAGVPNGNPATATTGRTANLVRLPRDMEGFELVNRLSGSNMILRGVYTIEGMARYNTTTGPRDQFVQLVPYYTKENRANNPQNTANVTSSTGASATRIWINATEDDVLIRGDKNRGGIGDTFNLQANPKVNIGAYYSYLSGTGDNTRFAATGESLNYSWKILNGADVIELVGQPAATKTDDSGPGKIGGVNFTLDASEAVYKAKANGVATVQVDMKNAAGETLATDTFYVEVFNDFSVSNSVTILPESGVSALITTNEYSTGFTFVPTANMQINMIIAEYNDRGALIKTEVRPVSLTANVSAFEALDIERDNTTKVFFWDANFVPLANTFTIG